MRRLLIWMAITAATSLGFGTALLLAAPEPTQPTSKRLSAFAKKCEEQRVAPAAEFQRQLLGRERARAAWTIVVRAEDSEVRLAHARQIAAAAQGTLHRLDPALLRKTIGETEKNLAGLFSQAEQKDWILFFDEADALFGKRTEVNSAHDRYANQEVSALADAIAKHRTVIVFGTRSTETLDPELVKRFADRVVVAKPKLPGPVPPLRWSDVCWTGRTDPLPYSSTL